MLPILIHVFININRLIQNKDSTAPVSSPAESAANASYCNWAVSFKQNSFDYKNDISAFAANLNIGDFNTHPDNINLQNFEVSLKDINLNNTVTKIVLENRRKQKQPKML